MYIRLFKGISFQTIMDKPKIVPQVKFDTLEDFINGNNNFWNMFAVSHRSRADEPFYKRFREIAPDLAARLEREVHLSWEDRSKKSLPWEKQYPWDKMWEAYKIMSNLVCLGDPYVHEDSHGFLLG